MNDAPACIAISRFELGWIFEFLEIVLVRAVPHVHFGLETRAAFLTILPPTFVPFVMVRTAQRVPIVIAVTRITREGKQNVIVFIVADPVAATIGARQAFGGRAAQAATTRQVGRATRWRADRRFPFHSILLMVVARKPWIAKLAKPHESRESKSRALRVSRLSRSFVSFAIQTFRDLKHRRSQQQQRRRNENDDARVRQRRDQRDQSVDEHQKRDDPDRRIRFVGFDFHSSSLYLGSRFEVPSSMRATSNFEP
jgi:hypothetical protein